MRDHSRSFSVAAAAAAEYPARPIRIIVPFTAGSASDMLARMIGPEAPRRLGAAGRRRQPAERRRYRRRRHGGERARRRAHADAHFVGVRGLRRALRQAAVRLDQGFPGRDADRADRGHAHRFADARSEVDARPDRARESRSRGSSISARRASAAARITPASSSISRRASRRFTFRTRARPK